MSLAIAIAMVVAEAAGSGVDLEAVHDEESIWISSIERGSGRPGSGADVLCSLMEVAEEHGVPIRAAVVRDHERLVEYYADLGFVPVEHRLPGGGRQYAITMEYAP